MMVCDSCQQRVGILITVRSESRSADDLLEFTYALTWFQLEKFATHSKGAHPRTGPGAPNSDSARFAGNCLFVPIRRSALRSPRCCMGAVRMRPLEDLLPKRQRCSLPRSWRHMERAGRCAITRRRSCSSKAETEKHETDSIHFTGCHSVGFQPDGCRFRGGHLSSRTGPGYRSGLWPECSDLRPVHDKYSEPD